MIRECKYLLGEDIGEVIPNLSVDIAELMATHIVPSSGNVEPYTNPDSIDEVGSYIRDKIDGTIAMLHINKSIARAKAKAKESAASPSSPGTATSTPSAQQSAE